MIIINAIIKATIFIKRVMLMLTIRAVHFDDFIPNWRTHSEVINYNVLVLVMEGKVTYRIENEDYTGERGDFMFIPHGSRRAGENHPSGPHQKFTIIFNYEVDAMPFIPFLHDKKFVHFKLWRLQYLHRRFERLYEEMRQGENFRTFICHGILQELIGIIARELEKPEVIPIKTKYADMIKHYLLDHYREQIEIKDLARLIQRSPNYTIAVFREVIGQSPIKYIHQLRVIEACNLLLNSDMSISNISNYLGYYDTSYFFRVFKKYTSMSPTDFMTYGNQQDAAQLFT